MPELAADSGIPEVPNLLLIWPLSSQSTANLGIDEVANLLLIRALMK